MITHIVLLKVAEEHRDRLGELKSRLEALPQVESVQSGVIGIPFEDKGAEHADFAVLLQYENRKAYDNYRNDPRHPAASSVIVDICSTIMTIDFES